MKNTRGIRGPAGVPIGQVGNAGGAQSNTALAAAARSHGPELQEQPSPSLRDTLSRNYDRVMAPQAMPQPQGQEAGESQEAAMLSQGQAPAQAQAMPQMPQGAEQAGVPQELLAAVQQLQQLPPEVARAVLQQLPPEVRQAVLQIMQEQGSTPDQMQAQMPMQGEQMQGQPMTKQQMMAALLQRGQPQA